MHSKACCWQWREQGWLSIRRSAVFRGGILIPDEAGPGIRLYILDDYGPRSKCASIGDRTREQALL